LHQRIRIRRGQGKEGNEWRNQKGNGKEEDEGRRVSRDGLDRCLVETHGPPCDAVDACGVAQMVGAAIISYQLSPMVLTDRMFARRAFMAVREDYCCFSLPTSQL
jgi:hypothetical protein